MKTNAIVRIVLFSIAIVILLGILLIGLGFGLFMVDTNSGFSITTSDQVLPVAGDGTTSYGAVSADDIREIEIEWAAGSITIEPSDTDEIHITESDVHNDKYRMVYKQNGSTLKIQFCEDDSIWGGISIGGSISKDLVIYVPQDFTLDALEIDAASTNVNVTNLHIQEVEFDGASGSCIFDDCTVDKLDMDTTSGDVEFNGAVRVIDFDGASANLNLYLTDTPSSIEVDTASGDLDLTLPADCGFTVSMDALSSDFYSDFPTTIQGKNYVYGDGSCRININAMSGEVIIREGN